MHYLSLIHNSIIELNSTVFKYLTLVRTIRLQYNNIKIIHKLLFSTNIKLTTISLHHNLIHQFNLDVYPLINLEYIYLSNNKLTTLNQSVFKIIFTNTSKIELSLQNNTFKCVCDMHWVTELKVISKRIEISVEDVCQSNNNTLKCWFKKSKEICQSINKSNCYDKG